MIILREESPCVILVPILVFILFLFGPSSNALANCEVAPGFDANEKFPTLRYGRMLLSNQRGRCSKG